MLKAKTFWFIFIDTGIPDVNKVKCNLQWVNDGGSLLYFILLFQ